jgi:hypothetical protein
MLVLPVLAAFATSLMVARAGLLIADFPEFSENTLAGKSGESSILPGGAALTWGAVWCPHPNPLPRERVQPLKTATSVAVLLLPTELGLT